MAFLLDDLKTLCASTNPRIEISRRKYGNVFCVIAEVLGEMCRTGCTYNKTIFCKIIDEALKSSEMLRCTVINTLDDYLDSGICCEHMNKGDLMRARNVVTNAKSKVSSKTKAKVDKAKSEKTKTKSTKTTKTNSDKTKDTNSSRTKNKGRTTKRKDDSDEASMYFKLDIDPEVDFDIARDMPFYRNDKLEPYRHQIHKTMPRELLGGLVLPTNDNLFDRRSIGQLGDLLGENKPISELYRKLGLSNALFCSSNVDLTRPIKTYRNYDLFKDPISRSSIKRLRASLCPNNVFKDRRDDTMVCCDKLKTIQSFVLSLLSNCSRDMLNEPIEFIRYLRKQMCKHDFSTKAQFINDDVMRFINYACGDIKFSSGNGIMRHDPNGLLRLNDFCKFSVTENYISDEDFEKLFAVDKSTALKKYGAVSDVDLIIKAIKKSSVSDIQMLTKQLHKLFDYNNFGQTMSGITSITMLSVLSMFSKNNPDFSYVLYANKSDCRSNDLWENAKNNHVIICINDYNDVSHWFCMGRFLTRSNHDNNEHEYFLYCSCNIVEEIFRPFVEAMYGHLESVNLPTIRTPIVENQVGGNYCGFWVLLLCYYVAIGDIKKIHQYFMKKVTEQEMLRLCRDFIVTA